MILLQSRLCTREGEARPAEVARRQRVVLSLKRYLQDFVKGIVEAAVWATFLFLTVATK